MYTGLPAAKDESSSSTPDVTWSKPNEMMPPSKRPAPAAPTANKRPSLVAYESPDEPDTEKPSFPVPSLPPVKKESGGDFPMPALPTSGGGGFPAPAFPTPALPAKKESSGGFVAPSLPVRPAPRPTVQEYDPAEPNDFEDVLKERAIESKKKARELEYQRRQEAVRKHDSEQGIGTHLDMDGGEAWTRRQLLSGARREDVQVPDMEPDPEEEYQKTLTPAQRMMLKMGYSGGGLGKEEQGMVSPLQHVKVATHTGKIQQAAPIHNIPPKAAPKPQPPKKNTKKLRGRPSQVIMLRNMVGPNEVDDELIGETKDECQAKYGAVEECNIHVVKKKGIHPCEAVRLFVKFSSIENAVKALVDLDGRFFAKRQVVAAFFDQSRYESGDLAPNPAEDPMPEECYN
eukprot:TRINITY_DN52291_c0_g1_i1.p1 TRINITY_DN52291_c0_g1~~TRINITY_DN52291_c0_g1_i1.p1  ORF type:complete len:401 (-),score=55.77 TRINITY_DN52291_c0_g1_i1:27-1229(-)